MAYTRYYIYKKQISLDGGVTWNDLYPSEIVPSGTPIGTYDTLLECEGTEMYRWVKTDEVSCKEIPTLEEILYGKFYVYKRQVSYDSGSTWSDTGYEVTSGDPITVYDAKMHCERDAIYRWEYKDMCINQDKYNIKVKQFSLDSGATWEDESPLKAEYLYVGTYNASSCGYKIPYEDALGKCFYNYACCNDSSNAICFDSYNEGLGIVWVNGGSITSTMNLGAPSSGYNICGITDYGMGKVKSAGNLNLTRLDGKAVKEVDGCNKISIGYGITSIPNYGRLSTLEELIIPSTVSNISDGAFNRGYLKRVVMLGATPPEIGENTFPHSDILTIYVPPESVNKYKSAIGWTSYADYIVGFGSQKTPPSTYKAKITDVFGFDYYISCDGDSTLTSDNTNIYVYSGGLTTYQVSITPKTKIKEIEVGSCVTTLGAYSMGHSGEDCYSGYATFGNVSKVTIPNSVTTIDERAFQNCTMLSNITIPNSVTSIGYRAFMNCSILSAVTIPSSVTSIGENVFYGCGNLSAITIPSTTTIIGGNAFSFTPWWNSYSADVSHQYGNIYYINNVAYAATSKSITSCQFKETTVSISPKAFYTCENLLGGIEIPSSVNYIGEFAFWNCTSITSVTIGSGVTSIRNSTFQYCRSLTSIDIPNSVTSIGDYAFDYCSGLTSCTIGSGVTSIGNVAFCDCRSLTSITIPDSVISIGEEAFRWCENVTSVTIGSGVTSMGSGAFSQCYDLSSFTIYAETPPTLGGSIFWTTEHENFPIYVPAASVDAYKAADVWKQYAWRIYPITTQYRWTESGTTCVGYDKYQNNIKEQSTDGGKTWTVVTPAEYSASTIIESYSIDCGAPTDFFVKGEYPDGTSKVKACKTDGTNTLTWEDLEFESGSINRVIKYLVQGCSNVTPVTTILIQALANIPVMQEIDLPSTITTIQDFAFYGDSNLSTLIIRATTPPTLGTRVFDNCSSLAHIYVPAASVSAYQSSWSSLASIISAIPT